MTVTYAPASEKQIGFVKNLVQDRDVPVVSATTQEHGTLAILDDIFNGLEVTKTEASRAIDYLLSRPKKPVQVKTNTGATEELTEGIYLAPSGDVIKLKKSKVGNFYAQVLVSKASGTRINLNDEIIPAFTWTYTPGLQKHITPAMRLTQAQAADFGIKVSRCMWCGRKLVASESVIKSIGPICIKKFA